MKSLPLSLGLAFFAAASLQADLILVQKVEGAGQNAEMTIKVKGELLRVDISPEASVIVDNASGKLTTVMHPQKAFMEMSGEATKSLFKNFQKQTEGATKAAEPVLKATGQKEKINGYDTELFTTETGGFKASYWIAKDFPNSAKLLEAMKKLQDSPLSKMAREMAPQPSEFPGVPVKTEVEMVPGQKVISTLVSAKEEALNDSDFTAPTGYQALAAPSFGGGAPQ